VLTEVADLAEQGVKEVTLLGRTSTHIAQDGRRVIADFALLLEYVAEIPGIGVSLHHFASERIHPSASSCTHTIEKLAPHVHLPVQSARSCSGDEARYTPSNTSRSAQAARAEMRHQRLFDFIVGFPGKPTGFRGNPEAWTKSVRRLVFVCLQPAANPRAELPTIHL